MNNNRKYTAFKLFCYRNVLQADLEEKEITKKAQIDTALFSFI